MKPRRILALLTGVLLLVWAAPAQANDDDRYLALGDSVAFGFDPLVPLEDREDVDNFIGYPEALAKMLDLDVANASCPGEASGGFISLTGVDNACRPYRASFPLHVDYATSQLDFAVAFLKRHPDTQLVTLNIGANDLFVLQRACKGDLTCLLNGLPAMLKTLGTNLQIIYGRIRGEARFRGQIVAVTYYSLNYADPIGVRVISEINRVVAAGTRAAQGQVGDGFAAFQKATAPFGGDSCKAGLLIRLTLQPLTCDIHPSPAGRDLLAGAIRAVVPGGPPDN